MTKAGMRGRPVAPLVLSGQERSYLERQVRRHRVARSLSERCRVILRCADGLPSKHVAAELGLHASGVVIGKCYKRHRAAEFLNFLKEIDAHVPEGLDIHIVMDNYATHKTPKIKSWLARRPHYHVHF